MHPVKLSRLRTCLIVDDNLDYLDAMRRVMQACGLNVNCEGSGAQAWTAIQSSPPDLLVTDLDMPTPNGLELLALSRNAGSHFFVMLVSGCAETVDHQRATLDDCCAVVLRKPWTQRALIECLQAADSLEHYRHCVRADDTA